MTFFLFLRFTFIKVVLIGLDRIGFYMCIASISYFICINVIIRVLNLSSILLKAPRPAAHPNLYEGRRTKERDDYQGYYILNES